MLYDTYTWIETHTLQVAHLFPKSYVAKIDRKVGDMLCTKNGEYGTHIGMAAHTRFFAQHELGTVQAAQYSRNL